MYNTNGTERWSLAPRPETTLEEESQPMKSLRFTFAAVLMAGTILAFGQTQPAPQTDAQKAFERLKTLAGEWEGKVSTNPPQPEMAALKDQTMHLTLRKTSMGNALLHEMTSPARPDDPITMLYLDEGNLLLTHYCDAGNRPRMTGKLSPDGKTVEFDFLDIAGNTKYGHMHHAVFTFIDENRHTEEWTFVLPGDKQVRARMDFERKK
jgi:hypothetical protein